MRLALRGNPTILLLLFTPDDQLVSCHPLGSELRALTPSILSRRVQGPFLGYLQAQKQRLTGEREPHRCAACLSRAMLAIGVLDRDSAAAKGE